MASHHDGSDVGSFTLSASGQARRGVGVGLTQQLRRQWNIKRCHTHGKAMECPIMQLELRGQIRPRGAYGLPTSVTRSHTPRSLQSQHTQHGQIHH